MKCILATGARHSVAVLTETYTQRSVPNRVQSAEGPAASVQDSDADMQVALCGRLKCITDG